MNYFQCTDDKGRDWIVVSKQERISLEAAQCALIANGRQTMKIKIISILRLDKAIDAVVY